MTNQRTVPLTVFPVPAHGAEDVVVDAAGWVYTGTADGSVFRVSSDGQQIDRVGRTGGRPLGLELLADGRLLVCDARAGLLALHPGTGHVEKLLDLVRGRRMRFLNNAAVAEDGTIFFSDSSTVHGLDRWQADLVEDTASGRLMRRTPEGAVEVLLEGLRFANGVALAADESFVAVAETGGRSVVRRWLSGPRAGQADHLVSDLPGYPDNIARGSDGLIWVTIASPVDRVLELVRRTPRPVRRLVARLPEALQPTPRRTVRVLALDDTGRVVHDLGADASAFHMVTGLREHHGRVWLGSLHEPALAVLDL
ncbi:SMP-30/gluconolactonase/LRE family protein [Nocardioides mesophilus]|uniref:SMP-30/gluconolactonase/LRE family protein n=1 Tax=Nocardioides mesophilus TaxID=433659 RepID=A0A7G9RBH3_9ACTN|nr:SMP-30/gluconolactonase/LRE family protein [Nocardioides mesophilus]QNN52948.1 SMP-30/gluconolactonase/LRE family protein [Nocardioides mesophilus]